MSEPHKPKEVGNLRSGCRTWWRLGALILSGWMMIGCIVRPSIHPPVALCLPRPALVDPQDRLTPDGRAWLEACLNAARDNCRVLKTIRNESAEECDRGLR